jgi:hypothetical protein
MAEAAKNITPPTTAYQFEVSWRGFSGDRALQACLLKVFKSNMLCIFYLTIFLILSIFSPLFRTRVPLYLLASAVKWCDLIFFCMLGNVSP